MCFVLYLGSRTEGPLIPWDEDNPAICTKSLDEHDQAVKAHFTLPCVTYIGSDQSCGCGFRYLFFEQGQWPDAGRRESDERLSESDVNHRALVAFIRQYFGTEPWIELYGCWYGDFAEAVEHRQEIALEQIADPQFQFKARGYCRVNLASSP